MRALSRPKLLALGVALFAATAALPAAGQPAPPSPDVIQKVYACAEITDPAARLACFDDAVGALKTAETQGQFAAVDAAAVRQLERESFGFSLPSLPRLAIPGFSRSNDATPAERTDELAMTIARIGIFGGRAAFVMDNGQTWAQTDSAGNRLVRVGTHVTIKRAAMGSYMMSAPSGPAVRVRRAE